MVYIPAQDSDDGIAKVVYTSKDRKYRKVFTALDWLARLVETDVPTVIPNKISSKEFRRNWARLIQKIYEVDPLTCPKCQGSMRIISFTEELDIIP